MSLRTLHRSFGLGLCLIIFSISATGVVLVWKKEYLWITISAARAPLDHDLLPSALAKIEATYPKDHIRFIQLYSEGLALHKIFLPDHRYAWHNQRGDQLETWRENERLEDWLLDLHHRFLLGNTIGLNIAGIGGLLLMPLLLAGFVLWWPRRRVWRLGLWPKNLERGSLILSHGNIGASFLLPIFVLALTGVILVYPLEARFVLVNGFAESQPPVLKKVKLAARPSSWQALITASMSEFPGAQLRWVTPPSNKSENVVVGLQQYAALNRTGKTSLSFEPDGWVTVLDRAAQPLARRVLDFSYPLHSGKLDWWYRLLLSICGLALAMLSCLGFFSFTKRS